MVDYKLEIASKIAKITNIDKLLEYEEKDLIELPKDSSNQVITFNTFNSYDIETILENSNNKIYFYQNTIIGNTLKFDNEYSNYSTTQLEDFKIYYLGKDGMYTVRWLSNGYSFTLFCPESLDWNEIEKIILSVEELPTDN